ncbi:MAG: AAC(3) family N-acetyltransferase [Rhodospirillaceae bacterium]
MSVETELVGTLLDLKPVTRDGILIVHSAFAGLSRAGLRAEAFCAALIEAMAGGTVLMPTMTWRSVNPASPVFDELGTPSHTGVLTEVYRTRHATHRSLHPTHSVAGCGPLAARLLSSHHLGTTPCPGSSPYGLIREYDTAILLLGVGMESCTAIHHAEEMIAPEIYVRPLTEAEDYVLIDRHGERHSVKTRRHRRLPRDFPKFAPLLKAAGALAEGNVHNTPWMLFSARDLYRMLFASLVKRADAILAGV